MKFLKRSIYKLFGNKLLQKLLEKNILVSQKLMGIGSGVDVKSSGEEVLLSKLLELKLPEVIVFDVGANTGEFSEMIISNLTGRVMFQLHSFEPSQYTFIKLHGNISPRENVLLNNFALGKNEGTAELFYEKEGSGLASLSKRKLQHFNIEFTKSEKIRMKTIDSYCISNNINRIDLLKIDVEGHELDVLEGSAEMFNKKAVRMVSFEFGGCNIDTRTYYQDFYYFFKEQEMDIYRIIPSGKIIPMNNYSEIHEQFGTTNFLALRKEN